MRNENLGNAGRAEDFISERKSVFRLTFEKNLIDSENGLQY